MSYDYQVERHKLFSEDGMRKIISTRDNVKKAIECAGVVDMQHAWHNGSGDAWTMMACVDYLVEIGELREINYGHCAGQHRIFVSTTR